MSNPALRLNRKDGLGHPRPARIGAVCLAIA